MTQHPIDDWVAKAEGDYRTCQRLTQGSIDGVTDAICFHAQQCIEKHLKAILNLHGRDAPKIHSLKVLVALCAEAVPTIASISTFASLLEEHAMEFRYPGTAASVDEAQESLEKLLTLRTFLRKHLRV
jgi:HEPN domain-containing protein